MSNKRQAATVDRVAHGADAVMTLTRDYPAGHTISPHFHDCDQLVYAARGVMTVRTTTGTWVVPTHRGVWIPRGIPHAITMSGRVAMRTLYLKPRLARSLPRACCVINVSPLLQELIFHACTFPSLNRKIPAQRHVIDMLVDQLQVIRRVPLQLPHVSDHRALRVAETLLAEAGGNASLSQICEASGASRRTIERLFLDETGMTFGKWRQQLRLMHALRLLGEGSKVTHVALEAGYSTPSAFIAAFRAALGTTPTRYFEKMASGQVGGTASSSKRNA